MAFVTLTLATRRGRSSTTARATTTPATSSRAVFPASSQGIYTDGGTAVKMRGLNIGSVAGIELLPDGRARVTLFLDDGVRGPGRRRGQHRAAVGVRAEVHPDRSRAHEAHRAVPRRGRRDHRHTAPRAELTEILAQATELFEHDRPRRARRRSSTPSPRASIGLGAEIGRTIDDGAPSLERRGRPRRRPRAVPRRPRRPRRRSPASRADDIVATIDEPPRARSRCSPSTPTTSTSCSPPPPPSPTDFADAARGQPGRPSTPPSPAPAPFVDGVYRQSAEIPDFIDLIGTLLRSASPTSSGCPAGRRAPRWPPSAASSPSTRACCSGSASPASAPAAVPAPRPRSRSQALVDPLGEPVARP